MSLLDDKGFKRKRYVDYVTELEEQAKEIFGSDIDLSDTSPIGQWIKLEAMQLSEENELAEKVWLSGFFDTATGISKDYAGKKLGITRISEGKAKGIASFSTTPSKTINAGMIVGTQDDEVRFRTTNTVTASSSGVALAEIEALEAGPRGNLQVTIPIAIKTPVAGVNSVTLYSATTGGRYAETDAEMQRRHDKNRSVTGTNSDRITLAILEVEGVMSAAVIENDSDSFLSEVVNSIPPHSIAPIVHGGNDNDIAMAIMKNKAAGIRSFGPIMVNVTNMSGRTSVIGFSRPTVSLLYFKVSMTKTSAYPADGDTRVKDAVISYVGGTDSTGVKYAGVGRGGYISLAYIYNAVSAIPGIKSFTVFSSYNGSSYTRDDIPLSEDIVGEADHDSVVIENA